MLTDAEILSLHREVVATRSVSGEEAELADRLSAFLIARGAWPERLGDSVLARTGPAGAPLVLLLTHLDTVPPGAGWLADPFTPRREDGKVMGLGANDAKASVAAMTAAFLAWHNQPLPFALGLALVEAEETKNIGVGRVLEHLQKLGQPVLAAVVGEPTGLEIAVAQKGLLVLELLTQGQACHAAHAARLGATNAARLLARDLVALEGLDFGDPHPFLGPITLEPTVMRAGEARNAVPATASAILDVRTTPALSVDEIVTRVKALVEGEIRVVSSRFQPKDIRPDAAPVVAARHARLEAKLFGSATLSDWALLGEIPAIKCGPGETERSHTAEEFVYEREILDGARFYRAWVEALAEIHQREAA